jgi:fatty acid desaturase
MTYSQAKALADVTPGLLPTPQAASVPQRAVAPTAKTSERRSANEYAQLKRLIVQEGLLDKQPGYYARRIGINLGLLALSVALLITVDNVWFQMGNALLMAFAYVQISFVAHNTGHRQVGRSARQDEWLTLLHMGLLVGLSPSWWVDKHNEHHGSPNVDDMDPDIDFPMIAFSPEQALRKPAWALFIVKRQAFFYPFLIMLIAFNMRIHSVLKLLGKEGDPVKHPWREGAAMLTNWVVYVGGLVAILGVGPAIAFIAIHNAAIGLYIASVFAANHKGMPILEKDHGLTFLHLQVLTSRNVRATPMTDFLYGGLNYQIEHHLFPTMPQNKLPRARELVKAFCDERQIPYYETGFWQSQKEVLAHLHSVSLAARKQA